MATQTTLSNTDESQRWYQVAMVWLVIMLPLSVVLASMITISMAFNNPPQLTNKRVDGSAENSAESSSDLIKVTSTRQ